MTTLCTQSLQERTPATGRSRPLSPRAVLQAAVHSLARTLATWQARNELRARLRGMPGYLLRDIGLDADDVVKEIRKPFWRP